MTNMQKIQAYKKTIQDLIYEKNHVHSQLKESRLEYKNISFDVENHKEAQNIIRSIAQTIQQKAHNQIESVVSRCLKAVFGNDYGFKIRFETKRNKTEAKLLLLYKDQEVEDVMDADSGGVIDVAALSLRIACLLMSKPIKNKVLIMDEPFKNLDITNRENLKILLEKLAEDFKIQFIIVTHETAFQTGNIITI